MLFIIDGMKHTRDEVNKCHSYQVHESYLSQHQHIHKQLKLEAARHARCAQKWVILAYIYHTLEGNKCFNMCLKTQHHDYSHSHIIQSLQAQLDKAPKVWCVPHYSLTSSQAVIIVLMMFSVYYTQ